MIRRPLWLSLNLKSNRIIHHKKYPPNWAGIFYGGVVGAGCVQNGSMGVGEGVGVSSGVGVIVGVKVRVGVEVGVGVDVEVGVEVEVGVGVNVGVGVGVGVGTCIFNFILISAYVSWTLLRNSLRVRSPAGSSLRSHSNIFPDSFCGLPCFLSSSHLTGLSPNPYSNR